jgi:methionine-rich copper-binding protein CopC
MSALDQDTNMRVRRWLPGVFALGTLPVMVAAMILPRSHHLYLEAELPKDDATKLIPSPPAIMLWFSQEPLPNRTEIRLLDANGAERPVSKVRGDPEDPFHFVSDVIGTLPAGKYKVVWLTYSDDEPEEFPNGLLRNGTFQFVVGAP